MKKFLFLFFSIITYLYFFIILLNLIGFVQNIYFEKTIDRGEASTSVWYALLINIGLLLLFCLQHSVMARKGFKEVWTRIIPPPIERSTYVLVTSVILHVVIILWQPVSMKVWDFSNHFIGTLFLGLSWLGWFLAIVSTFSINHFHLFGLFQTYKYYLDLADQNLKFRIPFLYKLVRHPLYLGFLVAFWFTPTMTIGHLLFSIVMTFYILIGIILEEKDLTEEFGSEYEDYQKKVPKILPLTPPSK